MSARMQLVTAIADCLRQIAQTAGYRTDAGQYVTTEPVQVPDEQPAVLAVVIERQQRADQPAIVRTHRLTTVLIVAKVRADADGAQQALDALISDVEQAMAGQHWRFANGTSAPQYLEMQPLGAEAGMGWAGALIRYQSTVPIH